MDNSALSVTYQWLLVTYSWRLVIYQWRIRGYYWDNRERFVAIRVYSWLLAVIRGRFVAIRALLVPRLLPINGY